VQVCQSGEDFVQDCWEAEVQAELDGAHRVGVELDVGNPIPRGHTRIVGVIKLLSIDNC
jgi:hypothetical protein